MMLISLLEFFKFFHLNYSKSRGFCILGRISKSTTGNTGGHWPSGTLISGGESFFSFCKEEEKTPKPEDKCVAKGMWEQAERQVLSLQADMILEK